MDAIRRKDPGVKDSYGRPLPGPGATKRVGDDVKVISENEDSGFLSGASAESFQSDSTTSFSEGETLSQRYEVVEAATNSPDLPPPVCSVETDIETVVHWLNEKADINEPSTQDPNAEEVASPVPSDELLHPNSDKSVSLLHTNAVVNKVEDLPSTDESASAGLDNIDVWKFFYEMSRPSPVADSVANCGGQEVVPSNDETLQDTGALMTQMSGGEAQSESDPDDQEDMKRSVSAEDDAMPKSLHLPTAEIELQNFVNTSEEDHHRSKTDECGVPVKCATDEVLTKYFLPSSRRLEYTPIIVVPRRHRNIETKYSSPQKQFTNGFMPKISKIAEVLYQKSTCQEDQLMDQDVREKLQPHLKTINKIMKVLRNMFQAKTSQSTTMTKEEAELYSLGPSVDEVNEEIFSGGSFENLEQLQLNNERKDGMKDNDKGNEAKDLQTLAPFSDMESLLSDAEEQIAPSADEESGTSSVSEKDMNPSVYDTREENPEPFPDRVSRVKETPNVSSAGKFYKAEDADGHMYEKSMDQTERGQIIDYTAYKEAIPSLDALHDKYDTLASSVCPQVQQICYMREQTGQQAGRVPQQPGEQQPGVQQLLQLLQQLLQQLQQQPGQQLQQQAGQQLQQQAGQQPEQQVGQLGAHGQLAAPQPLQQLAMQPPLQDPVQLLPQLARHEPQYQDEQMSIEEEGGLNIQFSLPEQPQENGPATPPPVPIQQDQNDQPPLEEEDGTDDLHIPFVQTQQPHGERRTPSPPVQRQEQPQRLIRSLPSNMSAADLVQAPHSFGQSTGSSSGDSFRRLGQARRRSCTASRNSAFAPYDGNSRLRPRDCREAGSRELSPSTIPWNNNGRRPTLRLRNTESGDDAPDRDAMHMETAELASSSDEQNGSSDAPSRNRADDANNQSTTRRGNWTSDGDDRTRHNT